MHCRGFWLRFMPDRLGNVEMNSTTMKEQPRNWVRGQHDSIGFGHLTTAAAAPLP